MTQKCTMGSDVYCVFNMVATKEQHAPFSIGGMRVASFASSGRPHLPFSLSVRPRRIILGLSRCMELNHSIHPMPRARDAKLSKKSRRLSPLV